MIKLWAWISLRLHTTRRRMLRKSQSRVKLQSDLTIVELAMPRHAYNILPERNKCIAGLTRSCSYLGRRPRDNGLCSG